MDDDHSLMRILIFIGFVLLDAAFYGFGSAIQHVNTAKLEKEMGDGNERAAKLLHLVNHPGKFINTIQIITTMIGMITGAYVLESIRRVLADPLGKLGFLNQGWLTTVNVILAMFVLMLFLISFGIVIPKHFAAKNPEEWGYKTLPIISMIALPLTPFAALISGISYIFLRIFGIDMNANSDNVTEEDIMSMVNEGHEQGVLEASEAEMITNIFEFDDKEASDIMTHRKNAVILDASITLQSAVDFILKEGNNSRYPVYHEDTDNIIGILHMRDALVCVGNLENREKALADIQGLLREAHFIPETRNINSLFKEMQSQKIHMEIVVDEYGQTAGIVTMEDILEEIVGNIMDEYDEDEEYVICGDDGSYIFSGMTPLEEVAETLDIEFEEEDSDTYDTLNGFLISKLDRIPLEDESSEVMCHKYIFKIMKVANKMIHTVRVEEQIKNTEGTNTETERIMQAENV